MTKRCPTCGGPAPDGLNNAWHPVAIIQQEVARFYNIPLLEMKSSRSSREVARPRQVAMHLAKILTVQSLPELGKRFGGRDHTTVIHAIRQVKTLTEQDYDFAQEVSFLLARTSALLAPLAVDDDSKLQSPGTAVETDNSPVIHSRSSSVLVGELPEAGA